MPGRTLRGPAPPVIPASGGLAVKRWIIPIAVIAVAAAVWIFQGQPQRTAPAPAAPPAEGVMGAGEFQVDPGPTAERHNAAAGLGWDVPAGWTVGEPRTMRVGTYFSPAAGGAAAGECAVFYFGPTQGGDVESNIQRWVGQFEPGAKTSRSTRTVRGMAVSLVEVRGVYLAPSGPAMQSSGRLEDHLLLGAIAQGPEGNVFFKFTGPEASVTAARKDFEGMIGSVRTE